jgi:aconitate hydratase
VVEVTGLAAAVEGGLEGGLEGGGEVTVRAVPDAAGGGADGGEWRAAIEFKVRVRLDTPQEVQYYRHGGILHYVLRQLVKGA